MMNIMMEFLGGIIDDKEEIYIFLIIYGYLKKFLVR